jgi:hypothetical protein
MPLIGKEVTDFVHACDAIDALLERGHTLTPKDRDRIEFNANELLDKLTTLRHAIVPRLSIVSIATLLCWSIYAG